MGAGGVEIRGPLDERARRVLTSDALDFVVDLHRRFNPRREALLGDRAKRQAAIDSGGLFDFLSETKHIRDGSWQVATAPEDLRDRRVEITGPTDRKMIINALNSGAKVYMADFEDANSPTWENMVSGQANLMDAVRRSLDYMSPDGRVYRLKEKGATLVVRPRGWHLEEKHILVDGRPISGSLCDFGIYLYHNAKEAIRRGSGPYFYLPKLEGHREALLWDDVFRAAEERLSLRQGTIKATVLIETIPAAFEMEEILYVLRDHASGLNAGRWDYIFSIIKKFRNRSGPILPDRSQITMDVPFMRAYAQLLVRTCHRRGAHAIGGMAAFVPSRRDPKANEIALAKVRDDKVREANDGFDGTWVAHPDLVSVADEVFTQILGSSANQLDRQRTDANFTSRDLLAFEVPGGEITASGVRGNVSVALLYLESWLRGQGAAAINNLMEDTATAEIARAQIWQWTRHRVRLKDGEDVTPDVVQRIEGEELARVRDLIGAEAFARSGFEEAASLFRQVALSDSFIDFLTWPGYHRLA